MAKKENEAAITPITVDFGREDLNALAAKVNEITESMA